MYFITSHNDEMQHSLAGQTMRWERVNMLYMDTLEKAAQSFFLDMHNWVEVITYECLVVLVHDHQEHAIILKIQFHQITKPTLGLRCDEYSKGILWHISHCAIC